MEESPSFCDSFARQVIAVSEQEITDAKAMIDRDGIGCKPPSATTVAGIRKLVAASFIRREESIAAAGPGHLSKDPDYVSHYHRGTLFLGSNTKDRITESQPIKGGVSQRSGPGGRVQERNSRAVAAHKFVSSGRISKSSFVWSSKMSFAPQ